MMIRSALKRDVPGLLRMGREFFKESGLSSFMAWDDFSFEITATRLIEGKIPGVILVADDDDKLVGMAACLLFPMYFNLSVPAAQELFWWVDPRHRFGVGGWLIEELEDQAKEAGASVLLLGAVSGLRDAAISRVYARRGYKPLEHSYIKELVQ